MTETLFVFNERNYHDCQNGYRGPGDQEYYLGDYTIEAGSVIDVRADRKAVGSCSIIRLRSKTRLTFRRAWSHIRQDSVDVAVLWFVKSGRMTVSHQAGHTVAKAGDFVVTKSMTPFVIECQTDEQSLHDVFHVIVPTHLLRMHLPQDIDMGYCTRADAREFVIAEHIFSDLFGDDGELDPQVAELLMNSALATLSHALHARGVGARARQSLSGKRLQDVLRFIELHLSDPKLSIATVAKGCGISPRYLSLLLKSHGTPFSTLVWEKRMQMASHWLSSSRPGDVAISEIAYKVGFKSSAHFSRMFKRVFNVSPREYRTAGVPQALQQRRDLFVGSSGSLQ